LCLRWYTDSRLGLLYFKPTC